ncbi:MAG: nuclease-related domain-containing protein [Kiritimatiellia bacterium]
MAKILRNETSLRRRQEAIRRELGRRQIVRFGVWGLVLAVAAWGIAATIRSGSFAGIAVGGAAAVLGVGYEIHLREIEKEIRNIEGGRRGEQKMANVLAEQLADDHVVLNDLEFRVAHERAQIDHLVIAPSGIYVIESKYWAGILSGDAGDAQWKQQKSNGAVRHVKSPIQQCERQRRMFITLLAARVPEDRIHALAVFTHPAAQLRISNAQDRAFLVRDAIRFINDRCFDPPVLAPAEVLELAERIDRDQA